MQYRKGQLTVLLSTLTSICLLIFQACEPNMRENKKQISAIVNESKNQDAMFYDIDSVYVSELKRVIQDVNKVKSDSLLYKKLDTLYIVSNVLNDFYNTMRKDIINKSIEIDETIKSTDDIEQHRKLKENDERLSDFYNNILRKKIITLSDYPKYFSSAKHKLSENNLNKSELINKLNTMIEYLPNQNELSLCYELLEYKYRYRWK